MAAKQNNDIVFAIPSKGSLYDGTMAFLKSAGVPVAYGNERRYTARLGGVEGISVLFQRAEEIPLKVASGTADLGLTGEDLFREQAVHSDKLLLVLRDLGYGHARLVVAVPNPWIDVASMEDLAELAFSFRLKHQRTLRIATKFPNLAREFLAKHGIVNYALVESLGATESAPASGVADLVIDLTSSGKTLSDNHLKALKDGTVISSQACLIASRRIANWNDVRLERLETFLDMIESHLRGRDTYNLQAAVQRSKLTELSRLTHKWRLAYSLPMDTLAPLGAKDEPFVVIRMTCPRNNLHQVIRRLRASGAEEVIVTQPEYVFHEQSESFQRLKRLLKKQDNLEPPDA
ncbi:MAG: phosphoribosyltransferase [Blastocatellia bacterium]